MHIWDLRTCTYAICGLAHTRFAEVQLFPIYIYDLNRVTDSNRAVTVTLFDIDVKIMMPKHTHLQLCTLYGTVSSKIGLVGV